MVQVENGPVRAHVQAFADEGHQRFGTRFTTYPGHSPTQDRALDCWDTDADMDALCQFGRDNYKRFGIDYIIWKQRIWNPEISDSWRPMADRGSVTQNHYDHAHFSFEPTGGASPKPKPDPTPEPLEEDDGMKLIAVDSDRGIFLVGALGEDGKGLARHVGAPGDITAMVESGVVPGYDKRPVMPAAIFDRYFRVVG